MKDVLKCALMRHGGQCVMMLGMPLMLVLFVHSLDTRDSVGFDYISVKK